MDYPKILNKDNEVIAYLNNLTECKIKEVINGEYTLSFIATVDDLKTQFLYDEDNIIEVNNDLFRALIIEELHTENNELTVSVNCEHISYDLLDKSFEDFSYSNRTATEMMVNCLQDTGFLFTGTDVTMKTNINYQQECNAKQISIAIANNWKGELQYHRHNIHLWIKRGIERGVDFRFGKNIKAIKKTTDRSKRDEQGNPALSYEIDIAELKHIDGFEDLEYFELGDTVRIVDDMLSINTKMRIVERVYNVLTETNESVVLGNILDDIRGSLAGIGEAKRQAQEAVDILDDNMPNWNRIKAITNDLGNVITQKLDGTIKTSQNKIENGTGTVSFIDNGILIHNQPTEQASTWAMKLTSGGLAIADTKNGDGTWKWTTMATGAGIVADSIVAGILQGIVIEGVDITGSTITGGTINGVTINGSTIYVGDRATGNYIELSPNNPIKVWRDNVLVSSLGYSAIGGGNLTIYDRYGDKAFWAECLEDGDFKMFFNNDTAQIPDPNNPGFPMPNPNRRKTWIESGNVIFTAPPKVHNGLGEYFTLASKQEILLLEMSVNQQIQSLELALKNKADKYHSHSIGYGGKDLHTHTIS